MPYYPDPNGGSMYAANEAEARSQGWQPSMGTFGIHSQYEDAGPPSSGGGGGSSGGGGVRTVQAPQAGADMDALRRYFGETAGFSREELAERARQFNEQMALAERQWEREGRSRLEIDQLLAAARVREIEATIGLNRAQLGLNYLQTAASMGGPSDYFAQAAFLRGARAAGAGDFLSSLERNLPVAPFSGVGPTPPTPQTPQGLGAAMGAGGAAGATDADSLLNRIGSVFRRGPTGLTPGSLERLDPDELALLGSSGKTLGLDINSFLRAYQRAGIGQQAAAPV